MNPSFDPKLRPNPSNSSNSGHGALPRLYPPRISIECLRLILLCEASSVLADALELYANVYERTILLRNFYGNETASYSVTTEIKIGRRGAERRVGVEGERRKRVMSITRENLATM